jgi:hypothetical protein
LEPEVCGTLPGFRGVVRLCLASDMKALNDRFGFGTLLVSQRAQRGRAKKSVTCAEVRVVMGKLTVDPTEEDFGFGG